LTGFPLPIELLDPLRLLTVYLSTEFLLIENLEFPLFEEIDDLSLTGGRSIGDFFPLGGLYGLLGLAFDLFSFCNFLFLSSAV
jgi:hypothetical protein